VVDFDRDKKGLVDEKVGGVGDSSMLVFRYEEAAVVPPRNNVPEMPVREPELGARTRGIGVAVEAGERLASSSAIADPESDPKGNP